MVITGRNLSAVTMLESRQEKEKGKKKIMEEEYKSENKGSYVH